MSDATVLDSPVTTGLNDRLFAVDSERSVGSDVGIPNPTEVDDYLDEHPALRSVLPRICDRVRAEFGHEAELTVELYRDPEINDQYLTLYVRQGHYDSNIVERIDCLSEPFAAELERCSGQILLTTDFCPPRSSNVV